MNVAAAYKAYCPVHLESGSCAGAVCREGEKPAAEPVKLPEKQFEVDRLSLSHEARMMLRKSGDGGGDRAAAGSELSSEREIHSGEEHLYGDHHHDEDDHDDHGGTVKQRNGIESRELSKEEQREVQRLQARDREVRAHEQAHVAASGSIAVSGPHYNYEEGPDGRRYAVGGSVNYQVPPANSPAEEVRLAQQLRRMALAPANPSGTDRAAAASAAVKEVRARREMQQERMEEAREVAEKASSSGGVEPSRASNAGSGERASRWEDDIKVTGAARGMELVQAYAGASGLLQAGLLISTEA